MADQQTLLSPKNADGTTNWDIVFEDPENGLIALINRVNSADALRQCGEIMIKRLFARKNDQLNVARFTKELDDIISYAGAVGDLTEIKAEVGMMLQRIKAIRVAKAQAYLEDKANTNAENRRSSPIDQEPKKQTKKPLNAMPLMVAGAIAALTVLVAFIYWVTVFNPDNEVADQAAPKLSAEEVAAKEKVDRKRQQEEAIQREVERKIAAIGVAKQREALREKRQMPIAIVLPGLHIQMPGASSKNRSINMVMPILVIDDKKHFSAVCLARPKLIDIVNIALSRSATATPAGKSMNFEKIAASVNQQINQHLRADHVIDVKLVNDGKKSDMTSAGDRCKYASDQYLDYIYPPKK